jgi:hypothetical protein
MGSLRGVEDDSAAREAAAKTKAKEEDVAAEALAASLMVTELQPKHNRQLLSDTIITITQSSSELSSSSTGYSYDTRNATKTTTAFCDACSSEDSNGVCETTASTKCLNGVAFDNSVGVCGFHLVKSGYYGCCGGTPYKPQYEGCCMTSPDVYEVHNIASGGGSDECFCSTCVDEPSPEPTPLPTPVPTYSQLPTPAPSPIPTALPSPIPTSVPTVVPTTPAPTHKPTQLWEGEVYLRPTTFIIGGSVFLVLAVIIRICFHKECIKVINCFTCNRSKNTTPKSAWNDMTPEEAEAKARKDMEREIRKQEAKAMQMKQFKSSNNISQETTNPIAAGGGSRAPGSAKKDNLTNKDSSGEFGT